MNKYYAVANGFKIGIYRTWKETEPLVKGFRGAKYKSFKTLKEAQDYLSTSRGEKAPNPLYNDADKDIFGEVIDNIVIYTDGSCINNIGGYGYLIIRNNEILPICGKVPTLKCTNQIAELFAI